MTRFLVVLCVLGACTGSGAKKSSGGSTGAGVPHLSAAEFRYGVSPARTGRFQYQPGVVLIEGGANSVKSVSADGLTWTLGGKAGGVADLAVGKIMFATGRGVGRVLAIRNEGKDKAVTIGPFLLTDVYRELDVSGNVSVDPDRFIAQPIPQMPGAVIDQLKKSAPSTGPAPRATPSVTKSGSEIEAVDLPPISLVADSAPVQGKLPVPNRGIASLDVDDFLVRPRADPGGFGIQLDYNKNGLVLHGLAVVRLDTPKILFQLHIAGGKVETALVQLSGTGGLNLELSGDSKLGVDGNINHRVNLPLDLNIPVPVGGIPLAVAVRHQFIFQTAFSSKDGKLKAHGEYKFGGALGFGLLGGQLTVVTPTEFAILRSLTRSVTSPSIGVSGEVLSYQVKVIVGLGAFGFATGPYFGVNFGLGISAGSSLGIIQCRGATLAISIVTGIGYQIPQLVTNAINAFLRLLNAGHIEGSGGVELGRTTIKELVGFTPDINGCNIT